VQGNSWRTTGDISDSWGSLAAIGFNQDRPRPMPGREIGTTRICSSLAKSVGAACIPPVLTPNEQYTAYQSLVVCCPRHCSSAVTLPNYDPFTLNLLENDEIIAVDQDPLGKEAMTVVRNGDTRVYARDLADGSKAVGLFNLGETETQLTVNWSDLGLKGRLHVRDLWRQNNLGKFKNSFSTTVPRHGVVLIRVRLKSLPGGPFSHFVQYSSLKRIERPGEGNELECCQENTKKTALKTAR